MWKSAHHRLHSVSLVRWGAVFQNGISGLSSAIAALTECLWLKHHSNTPGSVDVDAFSVEDVSTMPVWKKMASTDAPGQIAEGWAVTSRGRNMLLV